MEAGKSLHLELLLPHGALQKAENQNDR